MFFAAAVQMNSGRDKRRNLETAERLVRQAAAAGARLVALPEVFSGRDRLGEEYELSEPVPGPTTEALGRLASELGIVLQAGSILERDEERRRSRNVALLFSPEGELVARYQKIHLFDVDIPGQVSVAESSVRDPGGNVVTAQTELGTLGLSVCYDLRFPELYRRLVRRGATILMVPSAFTFPTGQAHWEALLRARAIENLAYVIAPNQYGESPTGYRDYGNSLVVDPWGTVIARASEGEGFVLAPIQPEYVERCRRQLPSLTHARLLD